MNRIAPDFRVMSQDDHGKPVRCSYCARGVSLVVVLSLTRRPELSERLEGSDGNELWVGLCVECVDAMRLAIEKGEPS